MHKATTPLRLRSREDFLGMLPYLLQYHPSDSVVLVHLTASGRVATYADVALGTPPAIVADSVQQALAHTPTATVMIIGYGPVTAADDVAAIAEAVDRHVLVGAAGIVCGEAFYCLTPGCDCDAVTGVPFDPRSTAIAAAATLRGDVALPSRADLLALAEPDPAAQAGVAAAIARIPVGDQPTRAELDALLERAMLDQRLTDDGAARMAWLLQQVPLRDAAWNATSHQMWQRNLWLDLTRRVPDAYVSAPAALAAWCAWMRGETTLALASARRAATVNLNNPMLRIIVASIRANIPADQVVPVWQLTDESRSGRPA
ncbi:DUF4192 domain-containing protein [Dactylosporangium sp. CA-233914]|uniref:DUF4192 domain-containing protein n=1 Tax=Dactylosporangium sp. CA-233914 TaxID=3239934 RepID=UPI003D931811